MKEEQRKEDQMKKDETNDLSSNRWMNLPWARCPICNIVWDTTDGDVSLTFWYYRWPDVNRYPVPAELPERLCPDHVEEIVFEDDGTRKGIKRTLYRDQVSEMKKIGTHCPVCRNVDLRRQTWIDDPGPWVREVVWECKEYNALILVGLRFMTDDRDEIGEIAHVSYREDLQTKQLIDGALNTIRRFIKSKEARSKLFCE
jgi:hypothetical protein